jgi:hypothetical protein
MVPQEKGSAWPAKADPLRNPFFSDLSPPGKKDAQGKCLQNALVETPQFVLVTELFHEQDFRI